MYIYIYISVEVSLCGLTCGPGCSTVDGKNLAPPDGGPSFHPPHADSARSTGLGRVFGVPPRRQGPLQLGEQDSVLFAGLGGGLFFDARHRKSDLAR